jgi:gamma-glutamyl-gamma-aminobutyraldehyde dehydrogenase
MNHVDKEAADWRQRARVARFDLRPLIDGARCTPSGAVSVRTRDPASGAVNLDYVAGSAADVAMAVRSARACFDSGRWSDLPPAGRKGVLLRLADLLDARAEDFALADSLDVGKPISSAVFEAHIAAHFIRWFGEAADKLHDGNTVPTGADGFEMHVRRPRGVVAAIVPWNYPVINAALKFAPALAAGNCVVLKPSELSPRSALMLGDLALEAGLPPGALNVLPGDGSSGDVLVRSDAVDMVAFTGSTRTGRALLRAVGDSGIRPLQLECGGKSPEVLFADVATMDLDEVAAAILAGSLANQGQLCVARTRIIVHDSLHDRLREKLVAQASRIRCAHPLDPDTRFGPLASERQQQIVLDYIESGVGSGAALDLDGRGPSAPVGGCYVGPTIFSGVDPASRIAREEIFGPVLCLFRFRDAAQALALANDSEYGLAATLWTRDLETAHRFGATIRAGKVKIMASPYPTPGSGVAHQSEPVGQSGFGVEGGIRGIETYTRLQGIELSFGRAAPR